MRHVFRNSRETIHVWASQSQDEGHSDNVKFRGLLLYSYSTVIAKIIDGGVLLTGRSYSVTTSGHCSIAHGAVHPRPVFRVPDAVDTSTTPTTARDQWRERIEQTAKDYRAATRSPTRARLLRELRAHVDNANRLCAFYRLPLFDEPPQDADVAAYMATQAAAVEAREAKARKAREARERKARKEARAEVAAWREGKGSAYLYGAHVLRGDIGDLLRLSADGSEVETSQGAMVPVEHVRTAAPLLLRLVASGKEWHTNGHTIHLGHYAVTSVATDGTLRAGCHTFKRAELERFAAVLGISS